MHNTTELGSGVRKYLDVIDELRAAGIDKDVALPQIAGIAP